MQFLKEKKCKKKSRHAVKLSHSHLSLLDLECLEQHSVCSFLTTLPTRRRTQSWFSVAPFSWHSWWLSALKLLCFSFRRVMMVINSVDASLSQPHYFRSFTKCLKITRQHLYVRILYAFAYYHSIYIWCCLVIHAV